MCRKFFQLIDSQLPTIFEEFLMFNLVHEEGAVVVSKISSDF